MNYQDIKALAKRIGCTVPDLLALSRNNDPFYVGSPTHIAQAEWFAALWERFGYTTGVHLRRVHYRLVNQKEPPELYNGMPYRPHSETSTPTCRHYLSRNPPRMMRAGYSTVGAATSTNSSTIRAAGQDRLLDMPVCEESWPL